MCTLNEDSEARAANYELLQQMKHTIKNPLSLAELNWEYNYCSCNPNEVFIGRLINVSPSIFHFNDSVDYIDFDECITVPDGRHLVCVVGNFSQINYDNSNDDIKIDSNIRTWMIIGFLYGDIRQNGMSIFARGAVQTFQNT